MHITALPIAIPLVAAATLVALRHLLPRLVYDVTAIGVAAASTTLCALILAHVLHHGPYAYFMGGWKPVHSVTIGISLSIDAIGAGMATFASALVTAALVYSWRYFESVDGLYHAMMLVFLAAMVGFSLTGDIFNLAVFFELMGATAYALTAYKVEEQGPIQGGINFAITNSTGAYAIFTGIALLYARTGALNMAQIGATLDRHGSDPLVLVAMALLFTGFLTKAATVPMHFWLGDAYAVAPTPVCVLFAGVMTEFGIYAVARLYWTIFAGPLGPHVEALRAILIAFATLTMVWGGIMCVAQRHIKRMLAFSSISHVGIFLAGIGLLSDDGLGGTAVYVVGNGLVMAALFMLAGILVHRFANIDEFDLHGRGRELPVVGVLFALGGIVLAAAPVVTAFFGKSLLEGASLAHGYPWLPSIFVFSSLCTGGAVLRVAGRVFLGWGPSEAEHERQAGQAREEESEEQGGDEQDRTPPLMILVPGVLIAAAVVIGLIPGAVPGIERAGAHFRDHAAYLSFVLHGRDTYKHVATTHVMGYDYLYGAGAAVGAVTLALVGLFGRPLRQFIPRPVLAPPTAALGLLRRLHSGHIGDYIAWWTVGAALIGGSSLIFLR